MGVIARVRQVVSSALQTFGANTGQSVVAQVKAGDGEVLNREVFHTPGVIGAPPAGEQVILLQLGDTIDKSVVIACQNYQITVTVNQGEVLVYSTNANGTQLEATIRLEQSGLIQIQNQTYNLLTALSKLIAGIQGATYIPYPGGVAGAPVPIVDTTGNIAAALTQLQGLLA
jgi:phage gp45-like